MNQPRTLTVIHKSPYSSWVRGPGITGLLDRLHLPRQYDSQARCWMTSRPTVEKLTRYATSNGWRVQTLDKRPTQLSLELDQAAAS